MLDKLQNKIEIKDDLKEGKKEMLILFNMLWLISATLLTLTHKVDLFNCLLIWLVGFIILVLPVLILIVFGFKKVKTIISDKKIEFYIGKALYFKVYWKNLEYVNIFCEKFYNKKRKIKTGYVIEFKGPNIEKIVRIWCFPFRMDKQELIVHSIKNNIHGINKPEIIENPIDDEIKIRSVECNEIDNFKTENR